MAQRWQLWISLISYCRFRTKVNKEKPQQKPKEQSTAIMETKPGTVTATESGITQPRRRINTTNESNGRDLDASVLSPRPLSLSPFLSLVLCLRLERGGGGVLRANTCTPAEFAEVVVLPRFLRPLSITVDAVQEWNKLNKSDVTEASSNAPRCKVSLHQRTAGDAKARRGRVAQRAAAEGRRRVGG